MTNPMNKDMSERAKAALKAFNDSEHDFQNTYYAYFSMKHEDAGTIREALQSLTAGPIPHPPMLTSDTTPDEFALVYYDGWHCGMVEDFPDEEAYPRYVRKQFSTPPEPSEGVGDAQLAEALADIDLSLSTIMAGSEVPALHAHTVYTAMEIVKRTLTAPASPQDVEGLKRDIIGKLLPHSRKLMPMSATAMSEAIDEMIRRGWRLSGDVPIGPIQSLTLGPKLSGRITEQEAVELVNTVINSQLEIAAMSASETPSDTGGGDE